MCVLRELHAVRVRALEGQIGGALEGLWGVVIRNNNSIIIIPVFLSLIVVAVVVVVGPLEGLWVHRKSTMISAVSISVCNILLQSLL